MPKGKYIFVPLDKVREPIQGGYHYVMQDHYWVSDWRHALFYRIKDEVYPQANENGQLIKSLVKDLQGKFSVELSVVKIPHVIIPMRIDGTLYINTKSIIEFEEL